MLTPPVQATPTHIITGFLGAGKTTLLKALMAQKPAHERWAILVNEFGQIGLDAALLDGSDADIAIKEIAGGCLCCTSQLPMQVGLTRLLQQAKPDRLWIEPTGLGHPDQLIAQLSAPHWQPYLSLQAVVVMVDGTTAQDPRYQQHEVYQAQLACADVVLVSHADQLDEIAQQQVKQIVAQSAVMAQQVLFVTQGQIDWRVLCEIPHHITHQPRSMLLAQWPTSTATASTPDPIVPPYHYVNVQGQTVVGGWCLPASWRFDRDQLLLWVMSMQGWLRIKGVMHTAQGCIAINLVPHQIAFESHQGGGDSRLEIIAHAPFDFVAAEQALYACLLKESP